MDLRIDISPDETSVDLSIIGTLTAIDMQNLISALAEVRARMLPEVGDQPPSASNPMPELEVHVLPDPSFTLRSKRDGGVRMWVQDTGLGWFGIDLPAQSAATLRDWLTTAWVGHGATSKLFDHQGGDGGTSKH